jgi:hypothetical protein
MASIKTLAEAETQLAEAQAQFPQFNLVIFKNKFGSFDILEKTICQTCGGEFLPAGVGEGGSHYNCEEAAQKQRDSRSDEQVQSDTAAWLAKSEAAESWNELI